MRKEIDIELGHSNMLLATIAFISLMAIAAIIALQVHWIIRLLLLLVLTGSMLYTLRQVLLLGQDAIIALRSRQADRVWLVKFASGVQLRLKHFNARIFRSLVIVQLINPVNKQRFQCIIPADTVTSEEHSQLRALLISLQESGDN